MFHIWMRHSKKKQQNIILFLMLQFSCYQNMYWSYWSSDLLWAVTAEENTVFYMCVSQKTECVDEDNRKSSDGNTGLKLTAAKS